jgi:hypothetical protein
MSNEDERIDFNTLMKVPGGERPVEVLDIRLINLIIALITLPKYPANIS